MLTRRQFLLSAVGSAAGFFLPSFVTRANDFINTTGIPLLEPAPSPACIIYAEKKDLGTYALHIGEPYELPCELTLEGLIEAGFVEQERYYDEVIYDFALGPQDDPEKHFAAWYDLHRHDEQDMEYIPRGELSQGRAFYALEHLDLGAQLEAGVGNSIGHISFIDGDFPGSDYLGVEVKDDLSLTLLQRRLIELDAGFQIQLFDRVA